MELKLYRSEASHLPQVFGLVQELALFERAPEAVTTNEDDYLLYFNQGLFDIITVVDVSTEQVVGMALFYETFSTWKGKMMYLEDFYVQPTYRQFGIGQQIFDEFLAVSKERGCKLVKWQVLDWNENALRFYEKNNATIEKEWWNGKIIFD